MTCPDDFEVNPLHIAANGTGERCVVPVKALDIVIDCCVSASPEDRLLVHQLARSTGRNRQSVNRLALFKLLNRHAKSHERPHAQMAPGFPLVEGGTQPKDSVERPRTIKAMVNAPADDLAAAFKDFLATDPEARFKTVCKANGIDPAKYAGRNFGLQRMSLGNELRGRLKKGQTVTIGERVLK